MCNFLRRKGGRPVSVLVCGCETQAIVGLICGEGVGCMIHSIEETLEIYDWICRPRRVAKRIISQTKCDE